MNKDKAIIFDFDGTMVDTFNAFVKIYNDICGDFGCKPIKLKDVERLRSEEIQNILPKYGREYGVNKIKFPLILLKGRRKLNKQIKDIKPIVGIKEILIKLKKDGFKLGVLTSNSKKNVKAFLKTNKMNKIFNFIYVKKSLFKKDKALKKILRDKKINKKSVIYVGDETRDIVAGKKVGIFTIAVSWGINKKDAFISLKPDCIIDTPEDIVRCTGKIFN